MNNAECITVDSVKDNPKDSVQMIKWMPGEKSPIFAAASFDGKVRIYEVVQSGNQAVVKLQGGVEFDAPVTAIEWAGTKALFVATADGGLYDINPTNGNKNQIGKTDFPVVEIKIYEDRDGAALLVFQLDDTILLHNLKSNDRFPTTRIKLKNTIVAADINENYLLIGLDSSKLAFIETKDLFGRNPEFSYNESTLSSPLTSVSIKNSSDKKDSQFVIASCDGRISIQKPSSGGYSNNTIKLISEITFRAAKLDSDNNSAPDKLCHITNVQCMTSKDRNLRDMFVAGAANGEVKIWDMVKRIDTFTTKKPGKHITAVRVNDDCTLIAFATGYSWSQGIWGLKDLNYSPEIFVRIVEQSDLNSKNNR
jgi:hypothetical protein